MFRPGIVVVTVLAFSSVPADVVFDERFETDPCAPSSGWVCREDAVWVAPGAAPCPSDDPALFTPWSSFDPLGPCTFYPGDGYVLLTPSIPLKAGGIFSSEPVLLDRIRLTVEIELRDGAPAGPGEGFAIILIGSPEPPELGSRGIGVGAVGLGPHPTFICAFRNGPSVVENSYEEIVYSWSATGFPGMWQIPIEEPFQGNRHILDRGTVSPGPNDSGLVLEIADGVIRGFTRYWEHPLFEIAPEGFDLASCFVGVTATTSSSYQNYVLRGIRVETAPPPLRFIRGDVNASGEINIADGIVTLGFLFCLGCGEPPCQDAADTDDNGQINITDSVRVLNWLFLGGPAPPAPGPLACGTDPTADDLAPCVYRPCD